MSRVQKIFDKPKVNYYLFWSIFPISEEKGRKMKPKPKIKNSKIGKKGGKGT